MSSSMRSAKETAVSRKKQGVYFYLPYEPGSYLHDFSDWPLEQLECLFWQCQGSPERPLHPMNRGRWSGSLYNAA